MEQYVILARSVTYAQRMQRVLAQSGLRSTISRAPRDLTDLGCAYLLHLYSYSVTHGLERLRKAGLEPLKVYLVSDGIYREVPAV